MLGNAVPSLLAEILARGIRNQLLDSPINSPLKLLPPLRHSVPRPERIKAVPKKYLSMVGNHPDHPGEGKGRQATTRKERLAQIAPNQPLLPL
jgi:DNA (cytosine-5)-methyltransferase 1